jgi:hypothetical protein
MAKKHCYCLAGVGRNLLIELCQNCADGWGSRLLLEAGVNRNIEALCFGIEAKQPKQTVKKKTEKKRKNRKKSKKLGKTQNFL